VVLGGAVLTLAALTFDASPLFVPGVGFMLVGLLTPAWIEVTSRSAQAHRKLQADRVLEDEPLEATVEVRRGQLGLPGAELFDPLVGEPVALGAALSPIRGSRTATVRVLARFPRRGKRQIERPALIAQDALGLARSARRESGVDEVLVLPRTERVRWSGPESPAFDASAAATLAEPIAAPELDGLRPYRPGSPASRIHWPALARGAGLLERRMRSDGDMRPLVVLDSRCSGPSERLDAAVRAAASLTLELARRSGCGLLLPGERRALEIEHDLAAWPAAHVRLALVEGGPDARAPALGPGGRLGPLVYVTAERLRRLPAGVLHAGRAVLLVLPNDLAGGAAVGFEVAGCVGIRLSASRRATERERAA
jgi:uncharacterized protein (DUF58 family)